MPDMTLIERVARAICRADGIDPDEDWGPRPRRHPSWLLYIPQARAALEAMREPSQAMKDASDELPDQLHAGDEWTAMINAALKESP